MSMLAERKRKEKWCLNPRGKIWADDSNKFGQKLLEKMGWSKGKGLGAKENGLQEIIRVKHKNDNKGIGFNENTEQWTENENQFSNLLKSLSSNVANGDTTKEKCNDDNSEMNSNSLRIQSLEKKSQNLRSRLHYHKFTRGKDLSRYSEKDIASIFGKKSINEINNLNTKPQEDSVIKGNETSSQDDIGKEQTSFGVTVIKGGSIQDYFNKRLKELKMFSKNNSNDVQEKDSGSGNDIQRSSSTFYPFSNYIENNTSDTENEKKKLKKKKHKLGNSIENTIKLEENGELHENDIIENESDNSKKRKRMKLLKECSSELDIQNNLIDDDITNKVIKRSKKNKHCDNDSLLNITNKEESDENSMKMSKRSKNSKENPLNLSSSFVNVDKKIGDSSQKIKEKKKHRKENASNDLNSDTDVNTENRVSNNIENSSKDSLKSYENPALQLNVKNDHLEINNLIKNIEKKKKSKKRDDSEIESLQGVINPALNLSADDSIVHYEETVDDTQKKFKKKKSKEKQIELNLVNGIENPALELSKEDVSLTEESNKNKKKKKKNKIEVNIGIENEGLQLSDSDNDQIQNDDSFKKKSKKNVSENINNEISILDNTSKNIKKSKNKKLKQVGIENPALDISYENSDICNSEKLKDTNSNQTVLEVTYKTKKSKKAIKSNAGIENPALNISYENSDLSNSEKLKDTDSNQSVFEVTRETKKSKKHINAGIENPALDISNDQPDNVQDELINAFEIERKKKKKVKKSTSVGVENPALDLNESNTDNIESGIKLKKSKHELYEISITSPALDSNLDDTDLPISLKKIKKRKRGIENPALDISCNQSENIESELVNSFEIKRKKVKQSINFGIENPALDLRENNINGIQFEMKSKKRKHELNEIGITNPALDSSLDETNMSAPSKKLKRNKQDIENPSLNLGSIIPNNNIPTPKSALKKKISSTDTNSPNKFQGQKRRKSVTINEKLNEEKYITDHETTLENSSNHDSLSDSSLSSNNCTESESGNLSHIFEKIDSYQNELENSINEAKEQKNEKKESCVINLSMMDSKIKKQFVFDNLRKNSVHANFPGANINEIKGYGHI